MKLTAIPCLLIMSLASNISLAIQANDATLHSSREKDALAIAEQLYSQGQDPNISPADKQLILDRTSSYLSDFLKHYPKSKLRSRALYLQAACQIDMGNAKRGNELLARVATTTQGEYAAAAAYNLAAQCVSRQFWEKAVGYYDIVIKQTRRSDMGHDSRLRKARSLQQLGKRAEAEEIYRQLLVLQSVSEKTLAYTLLSLGQMKTEDEADREAYSYFLRLLDMKNVEQSMRGIATLQAARIASKLGRSSEAQRLYSNLSRMPGMEKYRGEAQLESIITHYRNKNYNAIIAEIARNNTPLTDKEKEASRSLIIGQTFMDIKRYPDAAVWFAKVEALVPQSTSAIKAAYRRIVCAQEDKQVEQLQKLAENFLLIYPSAPATAENPLNDLVRLLYADRMIQIDIETAARQYNALRIELLPAQLQADASFRKAWTASQSLNYDPVPMLDEFIVKYKDHTKVAEAYALRALANMEEGKLDAALKDYDYVIANYPESDAAALSWQRAAQACNKADRSERMLYYYAGLIKNFPKIKPSALAKAHYEMGRVLTEKKPQDAVAHYEEARRINPERYASLVDLNLVLCYYKMKEVKKLVKALENLERANLEAYKKLPVDILRWCGWMSYKSQMLVEANRYLAESLTRSPMEDYKTEEGELKQRPQTDALVWKTLAKVRLELSQYNSGLAAANHYLSMEEHAYRKAEGMRDKSQLLIGLGRSKEAIACAEEAISLGIDGPIKSSLFLSLGDASYIAGDDAEAAKYYGRTANIVSDKNIKPVALYKIVCALNRCGKEAEASQYKQMLRQEFPDWLPSGALSLFMKQAPFRATP